MASCYKGTYPVFGLIEGHLTGFFHDIHVQLCHRDHEPRDQEGFTIGTFQLGEIMAMVCQAYCCMSCIRLSLTPVVRLIHGMKIVETWGHN